MKNTDTNQEFRKKISTRRDTNSIALNWYTDTGFLNKRRY